MTKIEDISVDYVLPPVKQATNAYLKLERLLVTLELSPSKMYSESNLIELVGMGRTPVREAIQRLEADGLFEVRSRLGVSITDFTLDDFFQVLELRKVLEPILARAATINAKVEHRAKVSLCYNMMTESVESRNMKSFLDADKFFDRLLADAANNLYLEKTLGPLQTHSRRFWFRYLGKTGLKASAELHLPIMQAFENNDPDQAEIAMGDLIASMIDWAKRAV